MVEQRKNFGRLFPGRNVLSDWFAGGEDLGYFALDAGGRRFESCRQRNIAGVAQWLERLAWVAGSPALECWRFRAGGEDEGYFEPCELGNPAPRNKSFVANSPAMCPL